MRLTQGTRLISWVLICLSCGCAMDRRPILPEADRGSNTGGGATAGTNAAGSGGAAGMHVGAAGAAGLAFAGSGAGDGAAGFAGTSSAGSGGAAGTAAPVCATGMDDFDHDGFTSLACGGGDCDDANPLVYPNAPDLCNGFDDDCTGVVDDGVAQFSCIVSNGIGSCMVGACKIVLCSDGFADCNTVAADGCEVPLNITSGDCASSDCAGKSIEDPADVPVDDGNDCTIEYCDHGSPATKNAGDGESCNDGNGTCQSGTCK